MRITWLAKMAWRDSRRNRSRLFLFMSSIILGIAALVAINSFGDNLSRQIDSEAKALLGADVEIESRQPIPDSLVQFLDSLGLEKTSEISFASMVLFPKSGGTRLINVRAIGEAFPFYGKIETNPSQVADHFSGASALVDQSLLLQFGASPGDSVRVGSASFLITGSVLQVPGQSAITTTVAPPVFIPISMLEETRLLQKGSRINYKLYLKYPEGFGQQEWEEVLEPRLEAENIRFDDVEERKQEIGEAYSDLTGFLSLTAFIALILGSLGVASSVHVYIKEKVPSVAVLRCMGAKARDGMNIFLLQIAAMGFIGSALGAIAGTLLQYLLPLLFADFLPFEVELQISFASILEGILVGVVISMLFALPPLLSIRNVSPLQALRSSVSHNQSDRLGFIVYGVVLLVILGFAWIQLHDLIQALIFSGTLIFAIAILAGVARFIMWLVRRYFPANSSFVVRQSLANLFRPNNQTLVLITTIGLGTALIANLFLTQDLLLNKVQLTSRQEQPNMVVFDIQSDQIRDVEAMVTDSDLSLIRQVPIVTMKLAGINGRPVAEIRDDTTSKVRSWILNREYRVTYRDSLTRSETVTKGQWIGKADPADSIFISLSSGIADDMQVDIGDQVTFNVQGALIPTFVGSFREIDWQRVQTNFLVVFPEGVLEEAPKFHVVLARYQQVEQSAAFQQQVVQKYPNVSVIDLDLILSTLEGILDKVSYVIQFMAFFSMLTGLIVLIGSVVISKYQRMQESVLLRTLGASRKQVLGINTLEYFFLGSLASVVGLLIALVSTWGLALFSFETSFTPALWPLVVVFVAITGLVVIIGLLNSRSVVRHPPMESLRKIG